MPRKKNRSKAKGDEAKRILAEEVKIRNQEIEEKNQEIAQLKRKAADYKRRLINLNKMVTSSSDYKMKPLVKEAEKKYRDIAANNRAIRSVTDECPRCRLALERRGIPRMEFPIN